MLENIEEIIRIAGRLSVEPERYGRGIMVCIDILTNVNNATDEEDATVCYTGTEIYDAVVDAASPGDMEAMSAYEKLTAYSKLHPEFLYAKGKTLKEALFNLEKRAELWKGLRSEGYVVSDRQAEILMNFVTYEAPL